MSALGYASLTADARSEAYAFGAVIFEVLTGGLPPHADKDEDNLVVLLLEGNEAGVAALAFPANAEERIVQMATICRAVAPAGRPTFSQVALAIWRCACAWM